MFFYYRFDIRVGGVVGSDEVEFLFFLGGVLGIWYPIECSLSTDFIDYMGLHIPYLALWPFELSHFQLIFGVKGRNLICSAVTVVLSHAE